MGNNILRIVPACMLCITFLAGCKETSEPVSSTSPAQTTSTSNKPLKIAFLNEHQFIREYGDSFHKKFPDIPLQVIPTVQTEGGVISELETSAILQEKPDLVFGPNLVMELGEAGKLFDLSVLAKRENMDLSVISPAVIDALQALGNGKLVALASEFQSAALYYNKSLFDRLQIPYPSNDISWQSLLELSKRIARTENGKSIYGLTHRNSPTVFLSQYIHGVGAPSPISEDGRKANYTSVAYSSAVEAGIAAFASGAFYLPQQNLPAAQSVAESLNRNKFVTGEAAMTIDSPGLMTTLKQAADQGIPSFSWDLVSEPIHPSKPKDSQNIVVSSVFGMMADSEKKDAAWTFLKYLISSELAAELPKTKPHFLSVRLDAGGERDGRKLDAFYAHRPIQISPRRLPKEISQEYNKLHTEEMTNLLYGRKRVADGLQFLQDSVQRLLDQANGSGK